VEGIALDKETLTLTTGTAAKLTATITPTYASNQSVTWSSSDESVATVEDGKVTAVAAGVATITVTAKENPAIKAECVVTVKDKETSSPEPSKEQVNPQPPSQHTCSWDAGKVTKASPSADGSVVVACKVCGAKNLDECRTIARPVTAELSKTEYVYTGKEIKPSVTVKDSEGKTIAASNYTVSYAQNKAIGTAQVTVTFKGEQYEGSLNASFTITPKQSKVSKLKAAKKGFKVTWSKVKKDVTGYEIQYSTSASFKGAKTVTVKGNKTTSKSITKLKAKKKYYVRVRTYKTVKGKKIYSAWSKAKSVKTKK
jgi:hypothetical protein